jgi:hypothetical protein
MKLAESTRNVKVSGASSVTSFGIGKKGMPLMLDIVSNKIYSDKPLAVLREYACNAADANTENGKGDVPIHISLPTRLEPVLKIRDNGKGLSEKAINETYVMFGESTKRDSNDFIGCLGIGSKSGFAYGDSFVVTSWHNGEKKVYSAFRNAAKQPDMARLGKTEKSDEPSGLEVQIPVLNADLNVFAEKARSFFKYWDVRPSFSGAEIVFPENNAVIEGRGWAFFKTEGYQYNAQAIAVMGKIPYPIDLGMMSMENICPEGQDWTKIIRSVLQSDFVFQFDIGDLEINAGRESLEYTAETQKTLGEAAVKASRELSGKLQKEMASCKTMFECKKFFIRVFGSGGDYHRFSNYIKKEDLKFKDNGQMVDGGSWVLPYPSSQADKIGASILCYRKADNRYTYRNQSTQIRSGTESSRIGAEEKAVYVLNETGSQTGILPRIVPLLELENNFLKEKKVTVYVITIKDKTKWAKWVKESHFDAPTIDLANLPKVKMTEIYPPKAGRVKSTKHTNKIFEVKEDHFSRYGQAKSAAFESIEVDLSASTDKYVIIDRFEVKGTPRAAGHYGTGSAGDAKKIRDRICSFIGTAPPRILAVREKDKGKLGKNMVNLFDWLREEFLAYSKKKKLEEALAKYQVKEELFSGDYTLKCLLDKMDGLSRGPVQELLSELSLDPVLEEKAKRFDSMSEGLLVKKAVSYDKGLRNAKKILKEAKEKYPLLFMAKPSSFHSDWKGCGKDIVEYVKMVDKFHGGSENEGEHTHVLSGMLPLTPLI